MAATVESDAVIANPLRAAGLVDAVALEQGRAFQRQHGGLLSEALLHLELVREADFLRIFAEFYNTKFVKAEKLKVLKLDPELVDKMGARTAERLRMCPIRFDEEKGELHVVAAIPLASTVEPEARKIFDCHTVLIYVATAGSVNALIRRWYYRELDAFDHVSPNGAGPLEARPKDIHLDGDAQDDGTAAGQSATTQVTDTPESEAEAVAPTAQRSALPPGATIADTDERLALPPKEDPESSVPTDERPSLPPRQPIDPRATLPPDTRPVPMSETPTREARPATLPPEPTDRGETITIQTLRRENARYRIAQEFNRRVPQERTTEAMVQKVLWAVFELLPAEGAAVALSGGATIARGRQPEELVEVPTTVIDQALASSEGVLINNVEVDKRFAHSESLVIRGVKSAMAVPLRARGRTIGILYADSLSRTAAFTNEDLPLLDAVGTQAAIMLDNAALIEQMHKDTESRYSLGRFLSPSAVDEIVSGRATIKLDGQKSEVTALFADIRGFTRAANDLSPEETVAFLNQFFTQMAEAVEEAGGAVDKFIGDCIMGLWGVPTPRPDDPRRALTCALTMMERARHLKLHGRPIELGIAVNTGDVVLGAIGSKRRLDYTAIGSPINLASRLCGIARSGEVLVTADTVMRAGSGVYADQGEPVFIKGIDGAMTPLVLKGLAPVIAPSPISHGIGDETLRGVPAMTDHLHGKKR